jgi:hypothetical protein
VDHLAGKYLTPNVELSQNGWERGDASGRRVRSGVGGFNGKGDSRCGSNDLLDEAAVWGLKG